MSPQTPWGPWHVDRAIIAWDTRRTALACIGLTNGVRSRVVPVHGLWGFPAPMGSCCSRSRGRSLAPGRYHPGRSATRAATPFRSRPTCCGSPCGGLAERSIPMALDPASRPNGRRRPQPRGHPREDDGSGQQYTPLPSASRSVDRIAGRPADSPAISSGVLADRLFRKFASLLLPIEAPPSSVAWSAISGRRSASVSAGLARRVRPSWL